MNNLRYEFLSYMLSNRLSAYRNGERIKVIAESSLREGGSCNQSKIEMGLHLGTHIDFPWHFLANGKTVSDYSADFFIVNKIKTITLNKPIEQYLLSVNDLSPELGNINADIECIIVKTGMCTKRYIEEYWNDNIGINKGVATYLRNHFPFLRFVGFDFMSVSGIHNRMLGREVHKEFFINNLLPIEDMDLSCICSTDIICQLVISPLRINQAEASPVTILAQIKQE